ncbi:MAG: hydroxyethylthiazole kinase [Actinomycetota bacterium]|nr:hydroxyethylthiazole kinase [Actinomycetota bacterium]
MNTIKNLEKIREEKPLIHHITNWVTIYDCANVVRTIGGLPVMAHAPEEVGQMTSISSALVLNIGTLTSERVKSMIIAGRKANEKNIPIILDVVGAGATDFRTDKSKEILDNVKVSILKGNSSEIGTIAGAKAETRGVEAISLSGDPLEIAKKLAAREKLTVVITGEEDIISNGKDSYTCRNGHLMMGCFVGSGCMASSAIGTFASVEKDFAIASLSALSLMGIAGEVAAKNAKGPSSYKEMLIDEIYNLDENTIKIMEKIEKVK